MLAPPDFRPEAPVALSGRPRRFSPAAAGFALACLIAGGTGTAEGARVYDPLAAPKARYVAPLAAWPGPSFRAKDFTVHRKGAYYHLFYTRVQRHVPDHWSDGSSTLLNETTFGHAISTNLETWFEADSVLSVSQDTTRWDAHHLWAPALFEHQDTTWMYLTGVRDTRTSASPSSSWYPRWQLLGVAWSTDPLLQQWTRLPDPVWGPCPEWGLPGVNWALCNPTQPSLAADFRDPFVLPPQPGSGEPWLLYYTARPRMDYYNYVVGVAQASGPRGPWTDLGALWDTYYPSLNSKVESPHVFRRGQQWHLMFTGDDGTTGIAWHTSAASPVGPWTNRPSLNVYLKETKDHPYEFALEPEAWYASEHFTEESPSGTAEYLAVVHSYDAPVAYNPPPPAPPEDISIVEFRRMEWDAEGFGFVLYSPNPVRALAVSDATVEAGQEVDLTFTCEGGDGRFADLATTIQVGTANVEVDPADLGLPARVAIADPQATLRWTVQAGSIAPPFHVTVSVASQPLRAGVTLEVTPGQTTDAGAIARGGLRLAVRGANAFPAATGDGAVLELVLPAAGAARVDVFDIRGRLVRPLLDDTMPAGSSTVRWDGRDAAGRPVPGGLYFARLGTALGSRSARLIAL